jgi:hypothetical protein
MSCTIQPKHIVFSFTLLLASLVNIYAADSGAKAGASEVNLARAGSSTSWTIGVGNASASDNAYVGITAGGLASNKQYTDYYYISNFNITVPADKTVSGISVSIERGDKNNAKDDVVSLVKGGVIVGDNKALNSAWSGETTKTYGGINDNWGVTWTNAEINAANFGVVFSVKKAGNGANPVPLIDKINITVTYGAPLPIELIFFDAYAENNEVKFSWETASETNNDFYTIERSTNTEDWISTGTIDGIGNSLTATQYNFANGVPVNGQYFYRLRQTDFDATSTVSKMIAVSVNSVKQKQVQFLGNSTFRITSLGSHPETGQLQILNILGALVHAQDVQTGDTTLNLGSINSGI